MVHEILAKLEAASKLRTESQDALLFYCRDQNIPLCERFPVWEEFVNKVENSWILSVDDFSPIGKWVRNCDPYEYDRYSVYTWKDFLGYVEDAIDYPDAWNGWVKPIGSVVEFKELLIQYNFGSFCNDW